MKLYIKNTQLQYGKEDLRLLLENQGLHLLSIDMGELEIQETLSSHSYSILKEQLQANGFDLVADKENILTEKIRNLIIEMIHFSDEMPVTKYSNYISSRLKVNYTYLSKVFSRVKKITIERFIILHKIERVKQLLMYNDMTLSEIALKLHYSSTAHLSAQFKKVTGLTPSLFKKSECKELIPVEFL